MNKNKVYLIAGVCLVLIICSSVSSVVYSKPERINPKKIINSPRYFEKPPCVHSEWTENFRLWREGSLSKEHLLNYIGGCKR